VTEGPPPRGRTAREALAEALRAGWASAKALSGEVGLPEKAVAEHLAHLSRSLKAGGERLEVEPARCLRCGRTFEDRRRLTKPSRCPACRSERIAAPRFRVRRAG
jgi:hypothetical protein